MNMNYEETKAAAFALAEEEQDELLKELSAAHTARMANKLAEGCTGWKRAALKAVGYVAGNWKTALKWGAALGAALGIGAGMTSCTYTHDVHTAGDLVTAESTAFRFTPGEVLQQAVGALLPLAKDEGKEGDAR